MAAAGAPDCHLTVRAAALGSDGWRPLLHVGVPLTKGRPATLSSPSQGAPSLVDGAPNPHPMLLIQVRPMARATASARIPGAA